MLIRKSALHSLTTSHNIFTHFRVFSVLYGVYNTNLRCSKARIDAATASDSEPLRRHRMFFLDDVVWVCQHILKDSLGLAGIASGNRSSVTATTNHEDHAAKRYLLHQSEGRVREEFLLLPFGRMLCSDGAASAFSGRRSARFFEPSILRG